MPDTFFQLVKEFPLTRIRDKVYLEQAIAKIDGLLMQEMAKGTKEYLAFLTDLVEAYETEYVPIPDASESEVLRELMRANGLSQTRLAAAVGIAQSTISAVLKGTRSLTKEQIITLARFFQVSPSAFLPA